MLNGSIELFIHYESACIFYINLQKPDAPPPIDTQLVSGFLAAGILFFGELGLGQHAPLFRILRGTHELRMWIGSRIHGTVLLKDLTHLDEKAYHEIDELLKCIIMHFEEAYIEEIEAFIMEGRFKFKGIREFIEKEVGHMKAHMYAGYLIQILATAVNRRLFQGKNEQLLISFNAAERNDDNLRLHNDSVWKEIDDYQRNHITLAKIIAKINKDFKEIWHFFGVPLIKPNIVAKEKK
jgi:hypothetical protein